MKTVKTAAVAALAAYETVTSAAVAAYETVTSVIPSTSAAAAAADDSVTAIEYSPERSEPEIDAREFSNNVSAMFDLTGAGGDGSSDDDDDSGGDSSDGNDQSARGYANRNTLNPDQIIERMRTMFETSLMLHANGKYMKACPAISTELYPHQMNALSVS